MIPRDAIPLIGQSFQMPYARFNGRDATRLERESGAVLTVAPGIAQHGALWISVTDSTNERAAGVLLPPDAVAGMWFALDDWATRNGLKAMIEAEPEPPPHGSAIMTAAHHIEPRTRRLATQALQVALAPVVALGFVWTLCSAAWGHGVDKAVQFGEWFDP